MTEQPNNQPEQDQTGGEDLSQVVGEEYPQTDEQDNDQPTPEAGDQADGDADS